MAEWENEGKEWKNYKVSVNMLRNNTWALAEYIVLSSCRFGIIRNSEAFAGIRNG